VRVGLEGYKVIELRGGRAAGQRMTVPSGTTEVNVPAVDGKGFDAMVAYRPSEQHTADGIELWQLYIPEPWSESSPVPLI
jgi:hypothetical protein